MGLVWAGNIFLGAESRSGIGVCNRCGGKETKNSGAISTPFVIGAIIELGNCLNLLEPNSISIVKEAHTSLKKMISESGQRMPVNKGANRQLDCAVIQMVHETNKRENLTPYDSIRCAFVEGIPIYPNQILPIDYI